MTDSHTHPTDTVDDAGTTDAADASPDPTPSDEQAFDPSQLVGRKVPGTVARVVEFGAFVDLDLDEVELPARPAGPVTGMVHVSEISHEFVDNIYAHLGIGDEVEVVVTEVRDDGKISLSMRRATAGPDIDPAPRPQDDKDFEKRLRQFMHRSQRTQGQRRRQQRQRLGD